MITPELVKYIETQTKENVAKDTIISKLVSSGWHREDIDEGFTKIASPEIKIAAPVARATPDPYREPTVDVIKPYKAKAVVVPSIEPEKTPAAGFIPALKSKETIVEQKPIETAFKIITPKTMAQNIPTQKFSNFVTPASAQNNNPEKDLEMKPKGIPKIALSAFLIIVVIILIGGTIFAYSQGLFSNVSIPFLSPSKEQTIGKIVTTLPNINMNKIGGTISFSSSLDSKNNFDGDIKVIDGIIYLNSGDLMSLLSPTPMSPDLWVSFNDKNVPIIQNPDNNLSLLEKNINDNIINTTLKIADIKSLIQGTAFISSVKEIGEENIEGVAMLHYQLVATEEGTIDVWVDKGTSEPKKFNLNITNGAFNTKLSFNLSDINQPTSVIIPEKSVSFHDLVNELVLNMRLLGQDTILKNSLANIPTEAEIYKGKFKSYGKASTSGSCVKPTSGSLFYASATNTNSKPINDILKSILMTTGDKGACYSTMKAWAVAFPLFSDTTKYYCLDSTGISTETTTALTKTVCQ